MVKSSCVNSNVTKITFIHSQVIDRMVQSSAKYFIITQVTFPLLWYYGSIRFFIVKLFVTWDCLPFFTKKLSFFTKKQSFFDRSHYCFRTWRYFLFCSHLLLSSLETISTREIIEHSITSFPLLSRMQDSQIRIDLQIPHIHDSHIFWSESLTNTINDIINHNNVI